MGTVVHRANSDIDFFATQVRLWCLFYTGNYKGPVACTLLALEFSDARHLSYPLPPSKQKSKSGNCQVMEGSPGQPPPPQNSVSRSHQGPESTKVWIGREDGFQSKGWGLSYAEVLVCWKSNNSLGSTQHRDTSGDLRYIRDLRGVAEHALPASVLQCILTLSIGWAKTLYVPQGSPCSGCSGLSQSCCASTLCPPRHWTSGWPVSGCKAVQRWYVLRWQKWCWWLRLVFFNSHKSLEYCSISQKNKICTEALLTWGTHSVIQQSVQLSF